MSKMEIIQKIANIHNTLAQIQVSGDGAISMGGALIELRELVTRLRQDAQQEEKEQNEET